jgi:hypothetical protein
MDWTAIIMVNMILMATTLSIVMSTNALMKYKLYKSGYYNCTYKFL